MANSVSTFWIGLGRGARVAVLGGATVLLALLVWGVFFAFRQDYRVLFAELSEADAGAVVSRLKQEKIAYRLSDDGTAILVPAEQVHDLRVTLMSGDLPLRGGIGFEIFDKQGLGVTEHSQRVSYQRALQGELARTIGSLSDVKQVRVHLVMPESTLFTRDRQQASAAVALTMRPGSSLERQQIVGVQRLVAAAVPGLTPERVVVTDQRGVTVSGTEVAAAGAGAADERLQVKREIEDYIARKVAHLLDGAFGPGQAIVSVDAALNFDATKTTIQDLLPGGSGAAEGRVVRRRQLTGAGTAEPNWTSTLDGAAAPVRSPSSSLEVEFEYGRRIDEIIAAPGAITRISVGVVVPDAITEDRRAKVAELVKMAAGIDEHRGDAITVQALSQIDLAPEHEGGGEPVSSATRANSQPSESWPHSSYSTELLAALILFALAMLAFVVRRRMRADALTEQERQSLLDDIQRALAEESRATRGHAR